MKRRTRIDQQWMRRSLAEADTAAALGEVPVGAVVVADGVLLGAGYNRSVIDADPSAHAEVIALRHAARQCGRYRLDGATLYVTIEPCLMCCGALLQARIARLVYGAREPRTGAVVSAFETLMAAPQRHHVAIAEGILADECRTRMEKFFAGRRLVETSR